MTERRNYQRWSTERAVTFVEVSMMLLVEHKTSTGIFFVNFFCKTLKTPTQVLSWRYCKFLGAPFFQKTPLVAVSEFSNFALFSFFYFLIFLILMFTNSYRHRDIILKFVVCLVLYLHDKEWHASFLLYWYF